MSEQDEMRVRMALIATDKIIAIFKEYPWLFETQRGKNIIKKTKATLDKMH